MRKSFLAIVAALSALSTFVWGQQQTLHKHSPSIHTLPPLREQASIINGWVADRKKLIPGILRRYGAEAWLVSGSAVRKSIGIVLIGTTQISMLENGEDPVFWLLKSAEQFSARRRTIYLFLADDSDKKPFEYSWIDNTPQIWTDLANVIEERNITQMVTNIDPLVAFSSGMHYGEVRQILANLNKTLESDIPWSKRMGNLPSVALSFIALQPDARLPWYRRLQETAWAIIDEAFSEKVITSDVTTTTDVEWWMRDKLQSLNYTTWFQPDVSVLNSGDYAPGDPDLPERVITYGDVLHVDFGVTALGMNTDTQHLGYVLRPGETEEDIPAGLMEGLRKGNRLQDIVRENMLPNRTGNEILKEARRQMQTEGIEGKIYCHGVGDFGHSGGAAIGKLCYRIRAEASANRIIGMTNLQDFVPGLGEALLGKQTWHSVELFVEHFVPELGEKLNLPLEEDVAWNKETETFEWVYGRQEKFHFVYPAAKEITGSGLL
jgi:hypothetical protein